MKERPVVGDYYCSAYDPQVIIKVIRPHLAEIVGHILKEMIGYRTHIPLPTPDDWIKLTKEEVVVLKLEGII